MFKRLSGNGSLLWKPKSIHSIEYLKYLHGVLYKNRQVNDGNKEVVIEALRLLAEVLVWGDQNETSIFDFFLERQMHQHFINIMNQKCHISVHVQLLQTWNIIFENLRNESALYFLLSNNNVNSVIQHNFDFNNEDIMAYFISFVKTLSLKLNVKTVHFFFNETSGEFPLLTVALKHFYNTEPMVRTAIRTVTLNIFRIEDESVQKFVHNQMKDFFPLMMHSIVDKIVRMDTFIRSAQNEISNQDRLSSMIDEQIGFLNYFSDIFATNSKKLTELLLDCFVSMVLEPLYLLPLMLPFESGAILLCPASCFFFLTNLLLLTDDPNVVQSALQPLLFGNENEVRREYRINSNGQFTMSVREIVPIPTKLLFYRRLNETITTGYDHQAEFFALLFLNVIYQKLSRTMPDLLEAAQIPHSGKCQTLNPELQGIFTGFLRRLSNKSNRHMMRPIAMYLFTVVARRAVLGLTPETECEQEIVNATEEALSSIVSCLEPEIFIREDCLDLFEEEYSRVERMELRIDNIAVDPVLLLPPICVKNNAQNLSRDLPFDTEDDVRARLQLYFILRKFHLDLTGQQEVKLPLAPKIGNVVEVNDCIDLSNSDLLMCSIKQKNGKSEVNSPSKALVTDQSHFILAETHLNKFGYGVVTNVGRLENISINSVDKNSIHVVIRDPRTKFTFHDKPVFEGTLVFPDSIRAFSAKQRLTTARKAAREFKIKLLCEVLGVKETQQPATPINVTSSPINGRTPGSVFRIGLPPTTLSTPVPSNSNLSTTFSSLPTNSISMDTTGSELDDKTTGFQYPVHDV
ncbi:hypothetical protein FO519_001138 [Halicephalobus sp. NKZ332]|nr:hypothetical protein FO519_001138 [Halicephalobus sp. NKZ332]